MHTSPMSPLRGSVLAAAILGVVALAGCGKADEEPRERDPNATTMRMSGPDGEEVTAEIVETENGMRMRIEGIGEEQTFEMELPDAFLKRFEERQREFDRRFKEDGRRFDELRKTFPAPGASSTGSERAPVATTTEGGIR